MRHIVSSLYAEYGRYIDAFRAIPKGIDCLKPVERRLLLSVHQVARKKLEKSAKVIGTCIGNYHPHGDCLHRHTKIFTLEGEVRTIEEIYKSKVKYLNVLGIDKDNNVIPVVAHSFRIGQYTKEVYNIYLLDGSVIRTTNNHQVNTLNRGWVKASNLTIYDVIVSVRSIDYKSISHMPEIYGATIESITIDTTDIIVPMYDFTVDEHENMFIVGNIFNNRISLISVHNSSTYESLVNLVSRGFVDGQGNWGKHGLDDSRAAAYRYTECKANDSLNNIFSDYLKLVPWEPLELENEPLYIPFPVPLGLIGTGVTTGIGFHTTKIPRYNYADLLNRLIALLENRVPITIIPQITDCTITEDVPGEFEKILTIGNGRLKIVPKTSIKSTSISILGRNPLIGFTSLKKLNTKHLEVNAIPLFDAIDIWNFNSTSSINIQITLSTKSKLLNQTFISLILNSISTTTNFRINVIEDNKVIRKSIDQLLLEGYDKWKDVNLKYYTNQLQFNLEKLEELTIIQIIREIVKNNPTVQTVDAIIKLNTSVFSDSQLRSVCSKHNIKTLIEAHIDINSVNTKINSLNKTITNIDTIILDELKYKYLKS